MIARTWRGATRAVDADAYVTYLHATGFKAYRDTPGNRGAFSSGASSATAPNSSRCHFGNRSPPSPRSPARTSGARSIIRRTIGFWSSAVRTWITTRWSSPASAEAMDGDR